MKKSMLALPIAVIALVIGLTACEKGAETRTVAQDETAAPAAETAATPAGGSAAAIGTVVETMDAGGYTYVLLDTGSEQIWSAGPVTPVEVGQKFVVNKGMPMPNFHSKALERDFEVLYFVGGFEPAGGQAQDAAGGLPPGHQPVPGMGDGASHSKVDQTEVGPVAKADGGYTVEEIFADKSGLSGQTVKVRGQVVKFTANIMGTNWVHIQDGTAHAGVGDLTVTTNDVVTVGDVVLVEGSLTVDKDFGAGYRYDAIIEGAKVVKE